MDLIDYMKKVEDFSLKKLEKQLREVLSSITFLSDYWLLSDEEIKINNTAFQWYHKMPEILENNRIIVENKTQEFQDALKGKYLIYSII